MPRVDTISNECVFPRTQCRTNPPATIMSRITLPDIPNRHGNVGAFNVSGAILGCFHNLLIATFNQVQYVSIYPKILYEFHS